MTVGRPTNHREVPQETAPDATPEFANVAGSPFFDAA
jgi:hypothetical protein